VENAIKIARFHTKPSPVIAFSCFHGRTLACISLTGKVQPYKAGLRTDAPGGLPPALPDAVSRVTLEHSLQALEQLFKADVTRPRGGNHIEPVLGKRVLRGAVGNSRRLARPVRQHGIVLIADEIQSGFAPPGACSPSSTPGLSRSEHHREERGRRGAAVGRHGKADIMDAPGPGGSAGPLAGSPLASPRASRYSR